MDKDNKKSKLNKFILTLLLLLVPTLLFSSPVFKDDFVCYDTTLGSISNVQWAFTALGGDNIITQVNFIDTFPSPYEAIHMFVYNRFIQLGDHLHNSKYEYLND